MSGITTKALWDASKAPTVSEDHPADDSYAPPVSSVKLPSLGLTYPPESPMYLLDSVDIKAVSAKEENILASPVLIKKGIVLTTLMRACLTNRSLDPDQMLVGDRNAILTSIRISAYGPQYGVTVTCPECGESADHDFDLSRLALKTLDVQPAGGPGSNCFEWVLPVSKRAVTFKLMDAATSAALDKDIEAVRKKTGQEQAVTLRLQAQILSIQGVEPKSLNAAITNMAARDAKALRSYMDSIAPGVDMVQEYECDSCGKTTEVDIPIGPSFFWPSED